MQNIVYLTRVVFLLPWRFSEPRIYFKFGLDTKTFISWLNWRNANWRGGGLLIFKSKTSLLYTQKTLDSCFMISFLGLHSTYILLLVIGSWFSWIGRGHGSTWVLRKIQGVPKTLLGPTALIEVSVFIFWTSTKSMQQLQSINTICFVLADWSLSLWFGSVSKYLIFVFCVPCHVIL